jgi:hypothetical membrane protein
MILGKDNLLERRRVSNMSSLLKRLLKPDVAATAGIVGPFYAFMSIMIAIIVSPWFTWTSNALSDLGNLSKYATSPISSLVFNSGLIVAGIITIFAALGLIMNVKKHIGALISGVVLLVGTIALICIGLFPENFPPWHFIFSVVLFVSIALAMLLFGGVFTFYRGTRRLGYFSLITGLIAAAPWIPYMFLNWSVGAAVPEIISAITVYLWIIVMCTRVASGKEIISS